MTTVLPTVLLAEVSVASVERLSPSFVRITLTGDGLRHLDAAHGNDTRFKMVFPGPAGALPPVTEDPNDWYAAWSAMPDAERAVMRTYTIRDVLGSGPDTRLVVDMVVHGGGVGPACRWAMAARRGDIVQIVAPHKDAPEYGGTEFLPGVLSDVVLVGDETALPAISRILADLDQGRTGRVYLEVPSRDDILQLPTVPGVDVQWVPRNGRRHGRALVEHVRRSIGLPPATSVDELLPELQSDLEVEVWETARHSSSGEDLAAAPPAASAREWDATYVWIAGESWAVKALRRSFVTDLGLERGRVAFMGYWREGVAMRS